jgi:putative phosphoribosyl transferase
VGPIFTSGKFNEIRKAKLMAVSSIHQEEQIQIVTPAGAIEGVLTIPANATGVVIFAHGSGSGRHSPRNRFVAEALQDAGLGTLLIDLLTLEEEWRDRLTSEHRFDIDLLAERLENASDWLTNRYRDRFRYGYFGASTGAAAALVAAARRQGIAAIVSRGGRPDLAGEALERVMSATLLIVGGYDDVVIDLNDQAFMHLKNAAEKEMQIVPEATHLFEEPGALEEVAHLASDWFVKYLSADQVSRTGRKAR